MFLVIKTSCSKFDGDKKNCFQPFGNIWQTSLQQFATLNESCQTKSFATCLQTFATQQDTGLNGGRVKMCKHPKFAKRARHHSTGIYQYCGGKRSEPGPLLWGKACKLSDNVLIMYVGIYDSIHLFTLCHRGSLLITESHNYNKHEWKTCLNNQYQNIKRKKVSIAVTEWALLCRVMCKWTASHSQPQKFLLGA